MEFLMDKMKNVRGLFGAGAPKNVKKREMTKCEGYFELVYKVLSWEDITLTLCVFLVVNFLFWLAVQLELRLFGLVFLAILSAFIADYYLEGCPLLRQAEGNHLEAFHQLRGDFADVVLSLKALRKDSPSSFCFGASVLFLTISFIAGNVSGHVIFYLNILAIFFTPLLISKYAPDLMSNFKRICRSMASDDGEDDLIPFMSDFGEKDTDLDSLLTDRTADSVTNSLISGLTSMPSYLDDVDRDLEEEDLLPSLNSGVAIISTSDDISTDSDSEHKGIRFESKHFNGDSSSEDDLYPKNFQSHHHGHDDDDDDVDVVDTSGVLGNIINVASVSGVLIGNILKSAIVDTNRQEQIRKDSSSESEFEIIDSNEANNQ